MKTLEELFSDKEFVLKVISLQSNEEIQKEFKKNGVKVSIEDIQKIKDKFQEFVDNSGKISDEEMEVISGGIPLNSVISYISGVGSILASGYTMYKTYRELHKPKSD